ncbi:MAG: twitching motility protein PilT [Eubacterium sp.]
MIQIICGAKGKGKTKEMLQKANEAVKDAQGAIVYVDKSSQHMYELNNQIRLINITEYPVNTYEGFIGFVSGLLSGNHDIECVFFDSLLKIAHLENLDFSELLTTLEQLSEDKKFIVSISLAESQLPETAKDKILVSC